MDFKALENERLLKSKFVFPLEDPPTDVFGKHLKDFEATGHSFELNVMDCKWYLACAPSCDVIDVTVKYSFFTEGILERKRQEVSECFGCCEKDSNTWRWYPRHEVDHVQVDTEAHSRCCGYCHNGHCCTGWCARSHTVVDIVTRTEASTGANDSQWGGKMKNKRVSLKLTPDEAEIFYVYCQNYTYNTNYHAARVYNMEFLKNVTSSKYQISPTDWVNYYLSSSGEKGRPPIPHMMGNKGGGGGGIMSGGGGGGDGGGGPCDSCGPCGGICNACCSKCG